MNRKSNRSRGQVVIIIALVLPVIVGVVALGADFAVMYYNWAQLQKAADSAALAGAGYLPDGTLDTITRVVNIYAGPTGKNGKTGDPTPIVTVDGSAFPQWVQVQLSRQVPYSFGRVLGLSSATLNVTAKAGIKSINTATGQGGHLLPLWIDCPSGTSSCPPPGSQIPLGSQTYGPANWGFLKLPGMNGVSDTTDVTHNGWVSPDLNNPNDVIVADPNQVPGCAQGPSCQLAQTGAGDVKQAAAGVQARIDDSLKLNLGDSAAHPDPADPRVVQIPIVNATGVTGASKPVPVLGFAEVWIDSVVKISNNWTITVTFIQAVSPGNLPGPSTTCVTGSSGTCTVVLEQ